MWRRCWAPVESSNGRAGLVIPNEGAVVCSLLAINETAFAPQPGSLMITVYRVGESRHTFCIP